VAALVHRSIFAIRLEFSGGEQNEMQKCPL